MVLGGAAVFSWRAPPSCTTTTHPPVFLRAQTVKSWPVETKSRLLQFVTGSSRLPVNGFRDLQGSDGPRRFTIEKATGGERGALPKSHTVRTLSSSLLRRPGLTAFRVLAFDDTCPPRPVLAVLQPHRLACLRICRDVIIALTSVRIRLALTLSLCSPRVRLHASDRSV
jgi:hypothetical protein